MFNLSKENKKEDKSLKAKVKTALNNKSEDIFLLEFSGV